MSVELLVVFSSRNSATREQWQTEIDRHGFVLNLGDEFDPVKHIGYLPCTRAGDSCGFEYSNESLKKSTIPEIAAYARDEWDTVATFVSRSHREDYLAATISAATLASATGGALIGSESTVLIGHDALHLATEAMHDYDRQADRSFENVMGSQSLLDSIVDDQNKIDASLAEVLRNQEGRYADISALHSQIRVKFGVNPVLTVNAWYIKTADGREATCAHMTSDVWTQQTDDQCDALARKCVHDSADDASTHVLAKAEILKEGGIELEFADGLVLRGVYDPHFKLPWALLEGELVWSCDEEGINVRSVVK